MKTRLLTLFSVIFAVAGLSENGQSAASSQEVKATRSQITILPIGHIVREAGRTFVRLDARCRDGLLELDEWSHIWVFYWFDRHDTPEKRAVLQVHPRGNRENPLTGVFATRSPVRPNLIALSLCRIVSIKGNDLEIESIDAYDQSPVIDIKPYLPTLDMPRGISKAPPWAGS